MMAIYSNLLVLGNGFLGQEFGRSGYTVWGRDKFTWPTTTLNDLLPYDVIINCIGNANTRFCESKDNWDEVVDVNAKLPQTLSDFCYEHNKQFVHISTGCVYDTNNTPQKEDEHLSSHCKYVVSKLLAEYACRDSDLILRPRLYFSDKENSNNLLTKIPNFQTHLNEINSYTSTRTIVEATTALLRAGQTGVFNIAQSGYATMEQICKYIGLPEKPTISGPELQAQEDVALVNNILDISKLECFYKPRPLLEEISWSWDVLNLTQ